RGVNADGARFVPQALANGAVAVVAETAPPAGVTVPWVQVPNARAAMAEAAAVFYRNPSDALALVGVTGTNGKTTTSYVLASIFDAAGVTCGRIGTIGYTAGGAAAGALRVRRGGRRPSRPPVVLARGPLVRSAHAARHVPRPLAARRPAERLQHPRRVGRGDGARSAVLRDREGGGAPRACA